MRGRWRTGLVSVILMAAAALTLPGASSAGSAGFLAAPAGTRAMWLWGDQPAAEVADWAAKHKVSEIFVYVSPSVLTDSAELGRLQQMKLRAKSLKIKLRALGGESTWTTDHAAALAWQKAVVRTGVFDGIHLDVEPYLTTAWASDLSGTQKNFLSLLDKMRMASKLPLEADVPFWYGQYQAGSKNFADAVLSRVHAVTVMSYRDTATGPNSLLEVSQDWLARGAMAGKRVRLAVETDQLTECDYCTFYGDGTTKLNQELSKVDAGTRQDGAFAGIAVHRYGSWKAMRS